MEKYYDRCVKNVAENVKSILESSGVISKVIVRRMPKVSIHSPEYNKKGKFVFLNKKFTLANKARLKQNLHRI